MKRRHFLLQAAFIRIFGLVAFLGFGLALLGIPSLTSRPLSDFKPEPNFHDGLERGELRRYQDLTALALIFYGGLLSYCLFRFLNESKAAKSRGMDGASLTALGYFTIYLFLVHSQWKFARRLPQTIGSPFIQAMMPADRLGWFLIAPADAYDHFVLEPQRYRHRMGGP